MRAHDRRRLPRLETSFARCAPSRTRRRSRWGEVAGERGERGSIHIRTWCEGQEVLVSIADTGPGIPDEVAGRVFDPFFNTKEVGRGTGQGLSISRTIIVERHGGSLTFKSEPGKGTTFLVRLPARIAVPAPEWAAA